MRLPQIGSIPLVSAATTGSAGGAFLLSRPAKSSAVLQFDIAEIEVHASEPYAVVRFSGSQDVTSAFSNAHRLVQQGLDLLSILGTQDAVVLDAENEHILCWSEPKGVVVRIVSTTSLEFGVGPAKLELRDKDGNVVPPMPIHPQHHIAFRYYRLAQTTDDLFDAYRNMYLAFEVLLSTQKPKIKGEKEIDWLRRSLSAVSGDIPLAGLSAKPGTDIVETILDEIYQNARLPLFHAKEGGGYYIPQDSLARGPVSHALGILTQLVLRMADKLYSARRMSGGVFFGWVYNNVRTQLGSCTMYASDYDGPIDATERDLSHPRFKSALTIPCRIAPEFQRADEPALMATVIGDDLSSVKPIRRLEVATTEHPYLAQTLDVPLQLAAIVRFEVLMHIRGTNLSQPRSLFRK
jgi:hypothetical protein